MSFSKSETFKYESVAKDVPDNITIYNVDRLDYTDAKELERLVNNNTGLLYYVSDIAALIHDSPLTLVARDYSGNVIAGIVLAEHPNIPTLNKDDWSTWIKRLYGLKDFDGYNSYFIHLMVYNPKYIDKFIKPMMQYIFQNQSSKYYVLHLVPPRCNQLLNWMERWSTRINPVNHPNTRAVQVLRLFVRNDFTTCYKIRRAVEEDNDDLVPLIDLYSARLREIYGKYYIAEIITRHPDSGRHIIVAEYQGLAVSVLCLNENVNYEDLNNAFHLDVFMGLLKPEEYNNKAKRMDELHISDSDVSTESYFLPEEMTFWSSVQLTQPKESAGFTYDTPAVVEEVDLEASLSIASLSEIHLAIGSEESQMLKKFDPVTQDVLNTGPSSQESYGLEDNLKHLEPSTSETSMAYLHGNAFAIEVAAAKPGHEGSLIQLLEAAYECFPGKEYCILTVPSDRPHYKLLNYFVRATPRLSRVHPHELYITHISTLNKVCLRAARENDNSAVQRLAKHMKKPGNLENTFKETMEDPKCKAQSFIITINNKKALPVGVAIVEELIDIDYLKLIYRLGTWINARAIKDGEVGFVHYFVLAPIFCREIPFLIRGLLELTNFKTLLHGMNQIDCTLFRTRPIPSLLLEMFPVPPRKMACNTAYVYEEDPFSLFIATARLTLKIRHEVNMRIVVVGASKTAIHFLESLLFPTNSRVVFNNVILVSKHGVPLHRNRDLKVSKMRIRTGKVDITYMQRVNLRTYVNIVYGLMTAINRKDKNITVDNKIVIPYDMLFLFCGVQYEVIIKDPCHNYLDEVFPSNMFTINDDIDAQRAMVSLKNIAKSCPIDEFTVVVYGNVLDAYCCVSTLLEKSTLPEFIYLVEPPPDKGDDSVHDFPFQIGEIYEKVVNTVKQLGVNLLTHYRLVDWTTNDQTTNIKLKFESSLRYLEMEAAAVFLYPKKSVNVSAFKAIDDCGLVMDGRLVIDHECRTNDPYIYSAGTMTKYSRKYYADHLAHKFFDHAEIGEKLGAKIRHKLTRTYEEHLADQEFKMRCMEKGELSVPIYHNPVIVYCQLPGNLSYMNVCKPGRPVPLETAMADDEYGTVLITGSCDTLDIQGYFRIHINTSGIIETITCLSQKKFDSFKICRLYGKHEALLNNLMLRYELKYIPDFYEYFNAPWTTAIFHDEFECFERAMMRIFREKAEDGTSLAEDMLAALQENGFKELTTEQRQIFNDKFSDMDYEFKIREALLDLIKENFNTLDMYAHPLTISVLLANYEKSPLFTCQQ